MKLKSLLLVAIVAVLAFSFKSTGDYSNLNIGDPAPMTDYVMKEVRGGQTTLKGAQGKNGLLVIFSCNTCPFVVGNGEKSQGWENRYNGLVQSAAKVGIETLLVNSNEAKRDKGDSYEDMVAHAKKMEYKAKYALDQGHKLADAFGAKTTPHVFLFNKEMKLTYQGAIDDNVDSKQKAKVHYLSNAIAAQAGAKDAPIKETKPVGCSIKRVATK